MSPRTPADGRWSRRGLLIAAAAAGGGGLAACSARGDATAAAPATATVTAEPSPGPTTTVTVTPEPAPVPTLPERPEPWTVAAGEVLPACKQAAVDFLVAAMSLDDGGRDDDALAQRLEPTGQPPGPALPLLGLLPGSGPAALAVRYSQYGGLGPDQDVASQMVVGDQLLLDQEGALVRRPFAADVRLLLVEGAWVVTSATPAFPDPPLPPLDPAIETLLGEERVELPGIAAADLRSGVVAAPVAAALLTLAQTWRISVHVFYSAHPVNVFPTTRPSSHTVGRAVDVWALDGIPVVDRAASPWRAFMEAAREAGASSVGGPELLQPAAGSFTDLVHQDHVHLGFPRPDDRGV
ncbi:hypothetical protein [Aquipuribacter sp. MA13-6]|uniref:hypothetical protein n=1 Tax=unclassified Aquipuribacter TaxID=2635084 RepID=UPI003EEFF1FD